jgi:hypothetical protein
MDGSPLGPVVLYLQAQPKISNFGPCFFTLPFKENYPVLPCNFFSSSAHSENAPILFARGLTRRPPRIVCHPPHQGGGVSYIVLVDLDVFSIILGMDEIGAHCLDPWVPRLNWLLAIEINLEMNRLLSLAARVEHTQSNFYPPTHHLLRPGITRRTLNFKLPFPPPPPNISNL